VPAPGWSTNYSWITMHLLLCLFILFMAGLAAVLMQQGEFTGDNHESDEDDEPNWPVGPE